MVDLGQKKVNFCSPFFMDKTEVDYFSFYYFSDNQYANITN